MTNEQLAIYLEGLQVKIKTAIKNAEERLVQEYPNTRGFMGKLDSKAFIELKAICVGIDENINKLTPKFP